MVNFHINISFFLFKINFFQKKLSSILFFPSKVQMICENDGLTRSACMWYMSVMVKISRDRQRPVGGCGCAQAARTRSVQTAKRLHNTRPGVMWSRTPGMRPHTPDIGHHRTSSPQLHKHHMGTARTRRAEQSQWRIGRLNMDPTVYSFLIRGCVCLGPFCCK